MGKNSYKGGEINVYFGVITTCDTYKYKYSERTVEILTVKCLIIYLHSY